MKFINRSKRRKDHVYRNQYDVTGQCQRQGSNAERLFRANIQSQGWQIAKSSKNQDIFDHVDFFVRTPQQSISVDVKAVKRIVGGRHSQYPLQDDFFLIEWLNVQGKKGWAQSKVDWIAFGLLNPTTFLMVKTSELGPFVQERMRLQNGRQGRHQTECKDGVTWTRHGRKDLTTLLSRDQLQSLPSTFSLTQRPPLLPTPCPFVSRQ